MVSALTTRGGFNSVRTGDSLFATEPFSLALLFFLSSFFLPVLPSMFSAETVMLRTSRERAINQTPHTSVKVSSNSSSHNESTEIE